MLQDFLLEASVALPFCDTVGVNKFIVKLASDQWLLISTNQYYFSHCFMTVKKHHEVGNSYERKHLITACL